MASFFLYKYNRQYIFGIIEILILVAKFSVSTIKWSLILKPFFKEFLLSDYKYTSRHDYVCWYTYVNFKSIAECFLLEQVIFPFFFNFLNTLTSQGNNTIHCHKPLVFHWNTLNFFLGKTFNTDKPFYW